MTVGKVITIALIATAGSVGAVKVARQPLKLYLQGRLLDKKIAKVTGDSLYLSGKFKLVDKKLRESEKIFNHNLKAIENIPNKARRTREKKKIINRRNNYELNEDYNFYRDKLETLAVKLKKMRREAIIVKRQLQEKLFG